MGLEVVHLVYLMYMFTFYLYNGYVYTSTSPIYASVYII
jgi:hypothetical protein